MSQSNIRIILIILAALVLGGVYLYVYKPNMDDKNSLDSEISTLQAKYDDLKAKEVHRDEYIALTKEYNEKFDDAIAIFPATLDQEISVMFMKGVEKDQGNLKFDINSVGLGKEELFYSLGSGGASADGTASGAYDCYKAAFPISYNGSYEGIKDFVDYIMAYKYRMNITSASIAYDASADVYSGVINLNAYCVTGGDRQADTVTTDVQNGVSNIFLGGSGAATPSSSGASTVSASSNDVKITLNNANGDSNAGVVISAGGSNITYSDNDVATVDVKIEGNTATISLGSDEITVDIADGASSFGIYVNSSARVDSDDTNGVKLNVSNSSDVAVDIKVDGDDSSSPRFTVGSKSGTVRVN